jgi:hypothetical protein
MWILGIGTAAWWGVKANIEARKESHVVVWRLSATIRCIYGSSILELLGHVTILLNAIRTGSWPPALTSVKIGCLDLTWFYYLWHGIYPSFRIFLPSFTNPRKLKRNLLAKTQKSARKAVEFFLEFYVRGSPTCINHPVCGLFRIWDTSWRLVAYCII